MFTTLYTVFTDFLGYLAPIWYYLSTPITQLDVFQQDSMEWWEYILNPIGGIIVQWSPKLNEIFPDISLLHLVLGGAVGVLIFSYVYKFIKGFIL